MTEVELDDETARAHSYLGLSRLRLVRGPDVSPERAHSAQRPTLPFFFTFLLLISHLFHKDPLHGSSSAGDVSPPIWFVREGSHRLERFRLFVGRRGLSPRPRPSVAQLVQRGAPGPFQSVCRPCTRRLAPPVQREPASSRNSRRCKLGREFERRRQPPWQWRA